VASRLAIGVAIAGLMAGPVMADEALVAVAANFTAVAEELAELFAAETDHSVRLSFGSTGQLYAQISQGAPFDAFLAADDERARRAIEDGLAVDGTAFTYAVGRLALYSPTLDVSVGPAALDLPFAHIAIADPQTAPYGAAAIEVMTALGVRDDLSGKIVTGENISQALQFVESGNAELGFVAASQVLGRAHRWLVPAEMHQPIAQDAVLLAAGAENPAAIAFLAFLRSPEAVSVIEAAGYSVP
jgi:molybdate transport system substrate-binding protein